MINRSRFRGRKSGSKIRFKRQPDSVAQPELPRSSNAALLQRARARPDLLPAAEVLRLQQLVGNQALEPLVAPSPSPGSSQAQSTTIQRFPADVLASPIDWNAQDFTIKKSGEGAMGGVAFFKSRQVQQGDIKEVVVKGLRPGEAEQVQFGESLLKKMGVTTPNGRIVQQGSPEYPQIAQALGLNLNENNQAVDGNKVIPAFSIMESLPAKSLMSLGVEAESEEDIDSVIQIMTNDTLLDLVGQLAVYDTVMGNFDRITGTGLNFGNIMVQANPGEQMRVWAIDTAASLPQLEVAIMNRIIEKGGFHETDSFTGKFVRQLYDDGVEDLADRFLSGLGQGLVNAAAEKMMNAQTEQEANQLRPMYQRAGELNAYYQEQIQPHKAQAIKKIKAGYTQGLNKVMQLLSRASKNNQARQELKGEGQNGPNSWETLKAHAKYMGLREKGLSHDEAAELVADYARYRIVKKGLPAPTIEDPAQFEALTFPESLLQSTGGIFTKNKKKYERKQQRTQDASSFYESVIKFDEQLQKHTADIDKLAPFATVVEEMAKEVVAAKIRSQGPDPNSQVDGAKKEVLVRTTLADLRQAIADSLAYAKFFSGKSEELLPKMKKMESGTIKTLAPLLQENKIKLDQSMLDLGKGQWALERLEERLNAPPPKRILIGGRRGGNQN